MLCAARIPLTYFNTDLTLHVVDFCIIHAHSVIASTGIEHNVFALQKSCSDRTPHS